ncbi:hypothetical protein ES703_75448 [subsurface metagenome]
MLEERINELKKKLVDYTSLVINMFEKSIKGLVEKNVELLTGIIEKDEPNANDFEIELDDGTIEGEVIPCPDCGVDLEITKIDGEIAKADIAEITEEDWGE